MDSEMELEVFRAGDYGARGAFSEEDLERIASDYDPAAHEAPVTVDHRQDGPALGWVRGLRRVGRVLMARIGGLDAQFGAELRRGAFKKRSIELYRAFEATGRPYLRALTFLGAGAPVVKGLADPLFAEGDGALYLDFEESGTVEPAAGGIAVGVSASQGERQEFREMEAEKGSSTPAPAPRTSSEGAAPVPRLSCAKAAPAGSQQTAPADAPATNESSDEGDAPASSQRTEMAEASGPDLPEVGEEIVRLCEGLRREGRILPAWEERGLSRFVAALDATQPRPFAATADAPSLTARQWFIEFLRDLAPLVPMGEAAPVRPAGDDLDPALPIRAGGPPLDPTSVDLHRRAVRYRQSHPAVCYSEALRTVSRGG